MRYNPGRIALWCSAGNAIPELEKHPGRSLALVPCTGSSCPAWEDGRCGHIERVGENGRM